MNNYITNNRSKLKHITISQIINRKYVKENKLQQLINLYI